MGEGRVIEVVSVTDRRYAPLVGVVAVSIARHLGLARTVRYHLLYDGAAGDIPLPALPAGIELVRHPVAGSFASLERGGSVSAATYLRLLIPDALAEVDRVIYLDLDLVVLADIAALFETDIGGAAIAGVLDFPLYELLADEARRPRRHRHTHRYLQRLGLDARKLVYVNAGVMLMELARLRASNFGPRATEMAHRLDYKLRWLDQDVMNVLLRGDIAALDPRWNSIVGTRRGQLDDPARWPFIVHFASSDKPWLPGANARDRGLWGGYARFAGITDADIPPAPPFVDRPRPGLLQRLLRRRDPIGWPPSGRRREPSPSPGTPRSAVLPPVRRP